MQEYPSDYGRGSRRVIMALGSLVVLGAAVYIVCSAAGLLPIRAEAATPNDADWSFAQPAYDSLSAQAIQVCSAENALKAAAGTENEPVRQAQVEVLSGEYNQAAQAYNEQVRSLVTAGERRP